VGYSTEITNLTRGKEGIEKENKKDKFRMKSTSCALKYHLVSYKLIRNWVIHFNMLREESTNFDTLNVYFPPPVLRGYMYGAKEAYEARNSNRLLAIRLETNKSCNLRCRYCYARSGEDLVKVVDLDTLKSIISEAKELGIKSVVVIGGGEPTLHPTFKELVAYNDSLGIIPMVFSNTVLMTEELAEFLYKHNASVMGKLDSLKPEVQDYIAGREGAFKDIKIDRKYYGYDWLPYTPITASGCLQHLYSLYINIEGNVRPCAPTKLDEHPAFKIDGEYPYNVNRMSLKEIYDSDLFTFVRNIDRVLEGRCGNCEYREECIGCRGYAYSIGINNGADPLEALRMECQQCFK